MVPIHPLDLAVMDILIFSLSHCGSAAPGLGAHGTVITNQPGTAGQPVGPPPSLSGAPRVERGVSEGHRLVHLVRGTQWASARPVSVKPLLSATGRKAEGGKRKRQKDIDPRWDHERNPWDARRSSPGPYRAI